MHKRVIIGDFDDLSKFVFDYFIDVTNRLGGSNLSRTAVTSLTITSVVPSAAVA